MSGARARLGDAPRDRASLLERTLAAARLACSTRRGFLLAAASLYRPALAVLARLSAPPTRPRFNSALARAYATTGNTLMRGKIASRKKLLDRGAQAIAAALQTQVAAKENRFGYDAFASGDSLYNYFRDYDPSIGRYIESDPIGLRGGLNTYGYVSGDPLGRFDRHGLAEQCETCGSGGGAGGGGGGGGGGPNNWPDYDPPLENVYPEFALFGAGAASRGGGAAAAAGAAIRNLYNKCKKVRCKQPEVHDPHHPFAGRKLCHLQLNCWLDGVKNSHFVPFRIPYPCDAPAPPFFKDKR